MRTVWLYAGSIAAIILLTLVSYDFYGRLQRQAQLDKITEHTYQVIDQIHDIENALLQAETGQRGFILTGDSTYLQPYIGARGVMMSYLDTLVSLVSDNDQEAINARRLRRTVMMRFDHLNNSLEQKRLGDTASLSRTLLRGNQSMDDFRQQVGKMVDIELGLLSLRKKARDEHERFTLPMFKVIFIISILFLLASIILMIRELRKRIRYQIELEHKIKALDLNNAELEQYAFAASHNLQEPLRKIRTFSSFLLLKHFPKLDAEAKEVIKKMDASAIVMQELIETMVGFTQMVQRHVALEKVSLTDCLHLTLTRLSESNMLVPDVTIDDLPMVMGEMNQLDILFYQLLENSIKYQSHERSLKIEIAYQGTIPLDGNDSKNARNYHAISITDNGIGFNDDYKDKVFQLFQRLETTKDPQSKGMGLAICKRIMTNHYGFIGAHGKPGKGAVFTLYFPIV